MEHHGEAKNVAASCFAPQTGSVIVDLRRFHILNFLTLFVILRKPLPVRTVLINQLQAVK